MLGSATFSPVLARAKRVSRDWVNESGICFCTTRVNFEHLRKTKRNKLAACRLAPKTSTTATSKLTYTFSALIYVTYLGTVLSIIFTAARRILSNVLSTLPIIQCRSFSATHLSNTHKPNKPSPTKKKLPIINSPFGIRHYIKVESMICVAVSSVGEDKEPTDLLKARPNLVA
jgi:hypothetical protein